MMQSLTESRTPSMAGKKTATKLEEFWREVTQAGLYDASFGVDETAIECSSAVGGCGWLAESLPAPSVPAFAPASNLQDGANWTDGYAAALCGTGEVASLIGELLGSAEESTWSDGFDSFCKATADDSWLLLSQEPEAPSGSLQTQSVPAVEQQESSVQEPVCASTTYTGCTRETNSPLGSASSVATITDEEVEFLADLDQLLHQSASSGQQQSASEERSAFNLDDAASSASFWQSMTDDTSSVDACTLESEHFASTSSQAHQAAQAPTGRRRGRKRCVSPSTRRERKRQQNREAAQRYRNRKHGEADTLDVQLDRLEERNNKLRVELRRAQTERSILLRFAENFDLRGLIREQLSANANSTASKGRLTSSLATLEKLVGTRSPISTPSASPSKQNPAQRAATTKIVTIVRPASMTPVAADSSLRKRREAYPNKVASKLLRC